MAFTSAGLTNNGYTQYYHVSYDDTLSVARGKDAANAIMTAIDSDFELMASWFPGVSLGTPINVNIANPPILKNAGGAWYTDVTLKIGEFTVLSGTPEILLRYLLVAEVTEMFMRQSPWPWSSTFNEGSNGEALSRFLSAEFLVSRFGTSSDIPALMDNSFNSGGWNVAQIWLNSNRDNHVEDSPDDIEPDEITGCGTLFLMYLRYQLRFTPNQIIQAGAATLAKVFEKLTGRPAHDGWNEFILLVDHHCPQDGTNYSPPYDNIFPVSDLQYLTGPSTTSWSTNGRVNQLGIYVDNPAKVAIDLVADNDNAILIDMPYVGTIGTGQRSTYLSFNVLQQSVPFTPTRVKFWVRYAEKSVEHYTTIVAPTDLPMPPLEIVPVPASVPCEPPFVEGTSQDFAVKNLSVFSDRSNLSFKWQITGAAAAAYNTEVLTIDDLPRAGKTVKIDVTVTSQAGPSQGIQAKGTFTFTTTKQEKTLTDMVNELNCRLRGMKNIQARDLIPPVEVGKKVRPEDLAAVESVAKEVAAASRAITSLAAKARQIAEGR